MFAEDTKPLKQAKSVAICTPLADTFRELEGFSAILFQILVGSCGSSAVERLKHEQLTFLPCLELRKAIEAC